MKRITAAEFKRAVEADPAWAGNLTEPVEIADYCDMYGSPITHLSPLLHFTGRDEGGDCANFAECNSLKVAEGTFSGWVGFSNSGIEEIGELSITEANNRGNAANFFNCKRLEVAEGTFPGHVEFSGSGIQKIGGLNIKAPDKYGFAAGFFGCKSLKMAEGTFPGYVAFSGSGIEKIEGLKITKPDEDGCAAGFFDCTHLEVAEGTFPGRVDFARSGINRISKGLAVTQANNHGVKADFTGCDVRLPKEFLGPEYAMEDPARQKNLGRIAVGKAMKSRPGIEI